MPCDTSKHHFCNSSTLPIVRKTKQNPNLSFERVLDAYKIQHTFPSVKCNEKKGVKEICVGLNVLRVFSDLAKITMLAHVAGFL